MVGSRRDFGGRLSFDPVPGARPGLVAVLALLALLDAPLAAAPAAAQKLPAPQRLAAAPAAAPAFEGDAGPFHVLATGGSASFGEGTVTLTGSVAVFPKARPELRITFSGGSVILRSTAAAANQHASTTYRNAAANGTLTRAEQQHVASADRDAAIASKQAELDAERRRAGTLEQRFADDGKLTPSESQQLANTRRNLGRMAQELARLRGQDQRLDQYGSLAAAGTLDTSLGGVALRVPNVTASIAEDGTLAFTGAAVQVRGCTHEAAQGSRLGGRELALAGALRCGQMTASSSTLKLAAGTLSGQGQIQLMGRRFDLVYAIASSGNLEAAGVWRGSSPGFQRVPGFDALEFQAQAPELRLLIDGPAARWQYSASKLELRTVATRPSGEAWAKSERSPNVFVIPAPPPPAGPGGIPIPYPNLAAPGDPLKSTRDVCLAAAGKLPDNPATKANERDAATAACHASNPQPPVIPVLPATVTVPLEKLIR